MATLTLHDSHVSSADAVRDDSILFDADFDAEELSIIDHLLVQANSQLASPALAIVDPDDYEGRHPQSSAVVSRRPGSAKSSQSRKKVGAAQGHEAAGNEGEREFATIHVPNIEIQYDDSELEQRIVREGRLVAAPAPATPTADEIGRPLAAALNDSVPATTTRDPTTSFTSYSDLGIPLKSFLRPIAVYKPTQTRSATSSPLSRFRTAPRKPLSVTDLISPAWCELQYAFTLDTPLGRKVPTAAMKQGTKVHRKLEDQVHRRVEVKVATKEEGWGLRVWNVVRGLRMMRNEGRARELEVWGLVKAAEGLEVVRGVVDEVRLGEEEVQQEEQEEAPKKVEAGKKKRGRPKKGEQEAEEAEREKRRQRKITDFTTSQAPSKVEEHATVSSKPTRKYFITDVKTRGAKTVPKGASLRPTIYQLMLYHRLLGELADGKMDFAKLWERHGLDPEKTFSDEFLARMASLDDITDEDDSDNDSSSSNAINTPPPESSADYETMQMPDIRRTNAAELPAYRDPPPAAGDDSTTDANDSFQTAATISSFTAALDADAQALGLSQEEHLFSSQPVEDTQDGSYSLPGSFNAADFLPGRAPSPDPTQPDSFPPEPTPPTTQTSTFTSSSTQTPFTPSQSLPPLTDTTLITTSTSALNFPTLTHLTTLLKSEVNLTFPQGSSSLSPLLRAEYRDKNSGEIMGANTFEYDVELLDKYLENVMQWWRGEREAKGVNVEEAWKCGSCEFKVGCGWRLERLSKWAREREREREVEEKEENEREGEGEEVGEGNEGNERGRRTRSRV